MERVHWKRVRSALLRYGDEIVELMKQKLQQDGKVATGNLINDIKAYTENDEDNEYLYVEIPSYGQYVDSGRRPNSKFPPRKSIRDWINVKGIRPSRGTTKKQLEYLIQRAIGVRGIDPAPFIDIFYQHTDELNDLIEESSRADLEDTINEFVKEYNKNK